jgi:hypothetical protein
LPIAVFKSEQGCEFASADQVKGKLVTLSCDRFDPSTLMANVRFPFSSQTGMGTMPNATNCF